MLKSSNRKSNQTSTSSSSSQHDQESENHVLQDISFRKTELQRFIELHSAKVKELKWVKSFSSDQKLFDKEQQLFSVELRREGLSPYIEVVPAEVFAPEDDEDEQFDLQNAKFHVFRRNVNDAIAVMTRALEEHHFVILTQTQRLPLHEQAPKAYEMLLKSMRRSSDALSKSKLFSEWEQLEMKEGDPVKSNFDELVKDITTTANNLAAIQALNKSSNCIKSDEDMMYKLAHAVTSDLKVHATNYMISNSVKTFNGLREGIEKGDMDTRINSLLSVLFPLRFTRLRS